MFHVAGVTQRESICLAYKHAGSFGRAFRHYDDSARNIPSSGSGEPSATHFPESIPPSPCGLRLDSLRSLRWEFVARACPAGAREATFFHATLIEHRIRHGECIEADLRNQIRFRELALAM